MQHEGYDSGHPWYYLLSGRRLRLKEIQAEAIASTYSGYMAEDIANADRLAEPKRSCALRAIRDQVCTELARDVSRYRELSVKLAKRRRAGGEHVCRGFCDDIHVGMSLKHNHLFNNFSHLARLDELLAMQGDLFG